MRGIYYYNFRKLPLSLTVHFLHWGLPFAVDRYPGSKGFTYRITFLCVNLHINTTGSKWSTEEEEY